VDSAGNLSFLVRIREDPPAEWSAIIGDAVHNARSALDHLAFALVEANGGSADENTTFPITDKPEGYGDRLRRSLRVWI